MKPARTIPSTRMSFHFWKCSIDAFFHSRSGQRFPLMPSSTRCRLGLRAWGRRLALPAHLGDRGPQDLDLDAVGDLDLKLLILDLGHLADDATGGHDRVSAADRRDHRLMLLEPLLLRPDHQEVHDADN